MKKLITCTVLTAFNLSFAMETDEAKIAPHIACTLGYVYRNSLNSIKDSNPSALTELAFKLQCPTYPLAPELESLLKAKLILNEEGAIRDRLNVALAITSEYAAEANLKAQRYANKNYALLDTAKTTVMSAALESVYKKTKCQLGIPLLQRITDPTSALPKDVEQLLKDEGILNDDGKIIDENGLCLALQAKATLLRDKFPNEAKN